MKEAYIPERGDILVFSGMLELALFLTLPFIEF